MNIQSLINFLNKLKANNNKIWFDKNRALYDELRKQWIDFTALLIKQIGNFDDGIAMLEPKNCVFRINKDIRFSKDKSPYKTNFGINLNPGGKKSEFMGYYLHVEPDNIFFAAGCYMPSSQTLSALRQEIDYNADDFTKIISNSTFKKYFNKLDTDDKLTRPPKGYDADNTMIEYLKLKHFIASRKFTYDEACNKNFANELTKTAKAAKPFLDFLRNALT